MYKSPLMWYTIYLYQQTSDTQNTYENQFKGDIYTMKLGIVATRDI